MTTLWILIMLCCLYLFLRQQYLLSPTAIFYLYYAFVYPIPYLVTYHFQMPSVFYNSPRDILPDKVFFAFLQVCLGLASFSVGRYLIPTIRPHWLDVTLIKSRFVSLTIISLCMALVGSIWVIHELGGMSAVVDNSAAIRSAGLRGLGAGIYAITNLLPTVAQFWLIYAFRTKSRYLGMILLLCVLCSALGGVFGFRGNIFVLLIQVACIYYLMSGKAYKARMAILILSSGILLSVLGVIRIVTSGQGGREAQVLMQGNSDDMMYIISDTSLTRHRGVEMLVIMNDYMKHVSYHYFTGNISETARVIIPSFILSKDIAVSEKIATAVYSGYLMNAGVALNVYGGVAYTILSECYWNMGLTGIVLVCVLTGYTLRVVEFRRSSAYISILHIIIFKAFASSIAQFLEAPQLGTNTLVINLFLNIGILVFLSTPIQIS